MNYNKELIKSLQETMKNCKIKSDGSAYEIMLEKEYEKALEGLFDVTKIYRTKDGRYKTSSPIQVCKKKRVSVLQEVYKHFYGTDDNITIEYLFNKWMDEFEVLANQGHRSWDTIDKAKSDWVRFFEEDPIVKRPIAQIKMSDLRKTYMRLTANTAISRKTLSNAKSLMNHVWDYAMNNNIITVNLARTCDTKDLICKEEKENEDYVYSEEECLAIINAAINYINNNKKAQKLKNNTYARAVILMFCLCLRIGELRAFKWGDVDFDNAQIYVHSSMRRTRNENGKQISVWTNTTKAKKKKGNRWEPLTDLAYEILRRERLTNPFGEFIFMYNDKPLDTTQFNRWLKRFCKAAGVEYHSSHKIRFTNITRMIDGNISVPRTQKAAGHLLSETTHHYVENSKLPAVNRDEWNRVYDYKTIEMI